MNSKFNLEIFFEFEKRYGCFDQKIGGVYFWDVIRYELYFDILRNIKPKSVSKDVKQTSILKKRVQFLMQILSFLNYLLFKRCDFLFITSSRNNIGEKGAFDRNLGDILNACKNKKTFLFEKFEADSSRWNYKENTLFDPSIIFKLIISHFIKHNDYSHILAYIHKEFEHSNFTNERINEIMVNYKTDLLFYSFLFKVNKPKICFVNQNGIQKGLFSAGKKCKVPIVEVQHCVIDEGNPAYHYAKNINYKNDHIYLPTYFFIFSSYWENQVNYPVKKTIEIGNSFLFNPPKSIDENPIKKNGLVVASADIFGENLKKIIIELAKENDEISIYFKLHPNQFSEKEHYITELLDFKNVQVISSEKNVEHLLISSNAILIIHSTTIYEALHLGKKGIIYKRQSYEAHRSLFNNPNVYLVDTAKEIITAVNQPFVEQNIGCQFFFKDFNLKKFNQFLAEEIN